MSQGSIKSCFVSEKELGEGNHCKFCKKSLIDVRDLNSEQISSKLNSKERVCVISGEGQLVDSRSFFIKISDSLARAKNLYSGYRLVYYSLFFVVMTTVSSCIRKKKYKGAIGRFKLEEKEAKPMIGYYHIDNNSLGKDN